MKLLKVILAIMLIAGIAASTAPILYADETSELILKLLIKKGIISQKDVDEMKTELAKEKKEDIVTAPKGLEERVETLEKNLPKWVKAMNVKGDLRLRQEDIYNDGSDIHRQRLRFRVGANTKLNSKLNVGFGIATGSSDTPTSTNQTLEQEFQSKNIWLDYAYAKYEPSSWAVLWGGKFKSPFYHTDMLWDSDIRFDGIAGKLTFPARECRFLPPTDFYILGGYFPLDDRAGNSEPNLFIAQAAEQTKFGDTAKLDTAATLYYFDGVKEYTSSAETRGTNTMVGGGFAHNFHVVSPYAKLTFIDPIGIGVPVSLIGEYANNVSAEDDNNAWRLAVQLGKKPKKKNEWRLLGQYSRIETDAFFDAFPDADFNSGGTNAKGWEGIFEYALWKNAILGLDYYYTNSINGAEASQHIIQSDVIFKF